MHEAADSAHEEVDGGVGGVGDGKDDGGEHHPQILVRVGRSDDGRLLSKPSLGLENMRRLGHH